MAVEKSPIPTIDVLPPMSSRVRDILYGVLAWAATIISVISTVLAAFPQWSLPDWLIAVNIAVNALWALGGFKAKANVTPAANVDGRHEADEGGQSALYYAVFVLVVLAIIYLIAVLV